MKQLIFVCAIILLSSGQHVFAAKDPIVEIRKKVKAINEIKSFKKVEKDIEDWSVEGGALTGYFDNDVLKKVVATHYGETFRVTEEFYFWNQELIFVLSSSLEYAYPINVSEDFKKEFPGGQERAYAERYYFRNKELMMCVDADGVEKQGSSLSECENSQPIMKRAYIFFDMLQKECCTALPEGSPDQHGERQEPGRFEFSTQTVQGEDGASIRPLDQDQEALMEDFSSKISQIGMGSTPQEVRKILGDPDLNDKETDIHLDGQDTIWTYKHPVIACARFIVIFRKGRVALSSMVVKDTSGGQHYLTSDDF